MPSLFQKISARFSATLKAARGAIVELYPTFYSNNRRLKGNPIAFQKLLQEAKGWVFACLRVIAEEMGNINIHLYKVQSNGDSKEITDHSLLDIFYSPNDYQTYFEFIEMMSMHMGLTGNAFILLDDGNGKGIQKKGDQPTKMWLLEPDRIVPMRKPLPEFIAGYEYTPEKSLGSADEKVIYQPWQILHIKDPNPNDIYMGMGPTQAASDAIDADNYMREYQRSSFRHMALPGQTFKMTTNNEDRRRILSEMFRDRYEGAGNGYRSLILPSDLDPTKLDFSAKDWNWEPQRIAVRDEILAQFGVPHVALGLGAGENLNRATADMTDYVFARRTIKPKMKRLIAYFNDKLAPLYGDDLVLDFDNPVPEDRAVDIQEYTAALAGSGWMTVNEVRDKQGLEPIEGGDVILQASGSVPFGTLPPASAAEEDLHTDTEEDQTKKGHKEFKKKSIVLHGQNRKSMSRMKSAEELTHAISAKILEALNTRKEVTPREANQIRHNEMIALALSYEPKVMADMKSYTEGMIARILSALPKSRSVKAKKPLGMNVDAVLDEDTEVNAIYDSLNKTLSTLAASQGVAIGKYLKIDYSFSKTSQEAVDKSVKLMARKYNEETQAALKDELQQAFDNGEGLAEITSRIQTNIGVWSDTTRATRVARTETVRTANAANIDAFQQAGVTQKVWFTNDPCEFCEPLDGKIVGIDENYFGEGDSITGANGGILSNDYSDVGAPPLHPNCKCGVVPYVES
jgi:HK97 family phage portal protein